MLIIEKNSKSIVKISDLGLATFHKYANHSHTSERGNISYCAPEALDSRNYDTRADIYSLGVVLKQFFSQNKNLFKNYPQLCHRKYAERFIYL